MPLWLAVLLLVICVGAAVFFAMSFRKNKRVHFIIVTIMAAVIGLLLLIYLELALILLMGT